MNITSERLLILQYNVWNSKTITEALLADSKTREYSILAIQEPWRNPEVLTSVSGKD